MAETDKDKLATPIAGESESGYPKLIATDDDGIVKAKGA